MKKMFALFLAGVMLLALCACGANGGTAQTDAPATNAPTTKTDSTAAPAEGTEPIDEVPMFPLTGDMVEFTVFAEFGLRTIEDWNQCQAFQVLEENTNVHLNWEAYSIAGGLDLFNIRINSGDYPDMYVGNPAWFSSGLDNMVDEDVIVDLSSYTELMPNYQALRDADHAVYANTMTDTGVVPGFYLLNDATGVGSGYVVRQDYLDATGAKAEELVTYDDWHDWLTRLGTETGAPRYMSLQKAGLERYFAVGMGLDVKTFDSKGFYLKEGDVTYFAIDDSFKNYVQTLSQWYGEGLIDPDFYSRELGPMDSWMGDFVASEELSIFTSGSAWIDSYAEMASTVDGFALTPVAMPVVDASEQISIIPADYINVGGCLTAIFTSCNDLEIAISYLDNNYSDNVSELLSWGVEGDAWTKAADGSHQFTEAVLSSEDGIGNGNAFVAPGAYAYHLDVQRNLVSASESNLSAMSIWNSNIDMEKLRNVPKNPTFTTEESEVYYAVMGDVETYVVENVCKYIRGELPLENWDDFTTALSDMGIEDAIAMYQQTYERYIDR